MAPTIDGFVKRGPSSSPASSSTSNSKKRSRALSAAADKPTTSKKSRAEPKPKLKKVTKPTWTSPRLSMEQPQGDNVQKCVAKWGLIAPFDARITEAQWELYSEFKKISSEELMQNTDRLLADAREKLVKIIMGSCMDDSEKTKTAKTFRGSFGDDYEDGGRTSFSPRSVSSTTRLYSPFVLGTSVDFKYHYHNRMFRANEEFSALVMCRRDIRRCSKSMPLDCTAEMGGRGPIGPPTNDSVRLFNWSNGKTMGTTASNISEFENTLFACSNWLSPRLIFNLLCAGGTATIYQEEATSHVRQEK
ncbi:hypothetical protein BKA65DRAFT_600801 [Rhexocercosporidium sp. MPI-PUGE-AT-0058]|nr:hypothetical protein BKA65DRAFT_600801 [Rhexocercosporidium sp. MPI-PUGE-AT-0058]